MSVPKISIIIPNYNYARYLDDALSSVVAQTFSDWECIVIDDASTDDSVKIINKYVKRDKRFKLIQMPRKSGISAARNAGLDAARGEYIAFLDSDDCYTEYALEMLYKLAQSTDADMVGGQMIMAPYNYKFVKNENASYSIQAFDAGRDPSAVLLAPKSSNWCWVWRRLYRRDLIGDVRFSTEFTGAGEDLTFMLDICWRAVSIVETRNVSVMHRFHGASVMHSPFDVDKFVFFPAYFAHIRDKLLDKYSGEFWKYFFNGTFHYLLESTIVQPRLHKKLQSEAKAVLIESCKLIPLRYLRPKYRILCWYLRCLKK